jgi:hypothetical protein
MRPLRKERSVLKKLLTTANFYAVVTVNVLFAADMIRRRVKELAETETVYSAREYVMVRAARGDYNDLNFDRLKDDYKFFETIQKFQESHEIIRPKKNNNKK